MQSEYYKYFLREKKQTLFSTDYAINNRLTPFISMQNHYNLIYREEEREMMPTLKVGRYNRHAIRAILMILNSFPALRRRLHSMVSTRAWCSHTPIRRAHYPR